MNFNMKCDIERNRGLYVGNVELSGVGRSGRKRVTDENFDAFLEKLKDAHDELLGNIVAYHTASAPSAPPTHHSETLVAQKKPVPVKKAKAGKPALHKATRPAPKKEAVRSFASA